jgi:hypothetical protein
LRFLREGDRLREVAQVEDASKSKAAAKPAEAAAKP